MCGIVGVFDRAGGGVDAFDVSAAVAAMAHRGPDETGFWRDGRAHLGMCRLSIIAPAGNHQPARNEDGRVRVVFNGQIYNHPALRRELEASGHRFSSDGDSEVIAHAYEEWGGAFCERLNGMFAIAVYDFRGDPTLTIARDRIGIKPLHYLLDDDKIVFGSEIKAVLAASGERPGVDVEGMLSLLTFEYTYAPHTLFEGLRKLPPGHYLRVGSGKAELKSYWQLPARERDIRESDAEEEIRGLLTDAVRIRLISDVPLGAFLSGGVDSSIIVALMARQSTERVKTFSVGFDDATYNETAYARMVADRYSTDHREITLRLDPDELMTPIDLMLDDPIGDFSVFSTYLVSRAAREHVTVALSGDGGDEMFGGYDAYLADRLARVYGLLGAPITRRLMPWVLSHVRPSSAKKGLVNRAKVFANGAARPGPLGHMRWMVFMDETLRRGLLTRDFAERVADVDPTRHVEHLLRRVEFTDATQRNMFVDAGFYLPDNILHKVDRTSMAVSLETRVPMLDHRVVEAALTLPSRYHIRGSRTKVLLKKTFADLLPEPIRRRGKQGFSTPMKHWLRGPLEPMMQDVLAVDRIRRDGYFRPETVERLKRQHLEVSADHAHVLWSLMLFCMWRERFQSSSTGRTPGCVEALVR